MPHTETCVCTARWLFPVDRPPLERGSITVAGDRIVTVEPPGRRTADVDLGNVALLPGLVNAHTHLDLSGLRGRCPPTPDFPGWLRSVIQHRRGTSPEQTQADIRAGIAESVRHGTTLLGDVAAGGVSWDHLIRAPLRSVVFHELIGLPLASATQTVEAVSAWLRSHRPADRCRPGLSPHAPYSTRDMLYNSAAKVAHLFDLPLATHLAETTAELELLQSRSGPFVEFLNDLGVWDPLGLVSGPEQVLQTCAGNSHALFVHGNYLEPTAAVPLRSTLVYCPRTHAAFGHAPHPFRAFLDRGVRVALGTDSLASNPDLDVLAEARFLHARYPDVPGATLLRMATLSGAEALGWAAETGSLTPGKSADLVVVPLPNEEPADPHELVLTAAQPVTAVLWRGHWTVGPGANSAAAT
jgi:cytosine/adenosine deaminase-related metal-dependent hydrolase